MGNTKHTNGPWVLDGFTIRGDRSHECSDSDFIANVQLTVGGNVLPSCEANARLIAAAPELLEALEEALEYIQSCPDQLSASGQVAREAARAAIAKVKGETA